VSGERWNGGPWEAVDYLDLHSLQRAHKILERMALIFHYVEKAECGDARREDIESKIYDMILKLGDELWLR